MGKVFVCSDTHFGHDRIRLPEYANRPYGSVEEMDEDLIKRWNETVSDNDVVFHLGDFAFGSVEKQKSYFDRLNGEKFLVLGNHDGSASRMARIGFLNPVKSLIHQYGDIRYHMVHNPDHAVSGGWKDEFVLFGHLHNTKSEKHDKIPTWVNCCVENWDYRPVSLDRIIMHIANRILESIPGFRESTTKLYEKHD